MDNKHNIIISNFVNYYLDIMDILKSQCEVVIYGAGENGSKVEKYVKVHGSKVIAFCDSDEKKQGMILGGIEIISPQQAMMLDKPIFIASTWYVEIMTYLKDLGASRVFNLSFIGVAKQPMTKHIEGHIIALYQRLEDIESKKVLCSLLEFLTDSSINALEQSLYEQYLHPSLTCYDGLKMIDGGACRGETLTTFSHVLDERTEIVMFEPEQDNFEFLKNMLLTKSCNSKIQLVPKGLWSDSTTLRFASATQSGAHYNCSIVNEGDINIDVLGLDDFCNDSQFEPNFIKMDIEGAEVEALKASVSVIQQYRPELAICLYHDLDDLWLIPEFIESQDKNYKFTLGHHSDAWFETVLYCF